MRVLVTGADSRLARAIMTALSGSASIVATDVGFTELLPFGVEFHEGDLCDGELVGALLDGADTVLHLAPLRSIGGDDLVDLDEATRGTYTLVTSALDKGIRKLVIGSTLDLFDRLPALWGVNEMWRPRPEPRAEHLRAWLTELSARELARTADATVVCLRFGHPVDDLEAASLPYDPHWLHIEDAVAGVWRALKYEVPGWSVFHITAAGRCSKIRLALAGGKSFGYQPKHDFRYKWEGRIPEDDMLVAPDEAWKRVLAPRVRTQSRQIRNVVIFGAGGPVAAEVARELSADYRLRLTDVRPISEIEAEGPRPDQGPGAPVPVALESPHECRVVDVTNLEEVANACEGMDAVINCSVVRHDIEKAFRVNTLGVYNIAHAAAVHGIRRIVHTGPQLFTLHGAGDYSSDYDIPADAPPRAGRHLYGHSKYLGQEICRVFADYYDLEVLVLLFTSFVQPGIEQSRPIYPFAVSWQDAARAIRCAIEVNALPSPYEVLNISTDLPHGQFDNHKAKHVLGWQPQDNLGYLWIDGDYEDGE